MENGEKYLSIKLAGHDYVKAFPNKDKTAPNQPDFKGDGVAVWVQEKGVKTADVKPQEVMETQESVQ